jgi:hypothetical protein
MQELNIYQTWYTTRDMNLAPSSMMGNPDALHWGELMAETVDICVTMTHYWLYCKLPSPQS